MIKAIQDAVVERETNYPGDAYYWDNPEDCIDDADFWYSACLYLLNEKYKASTRDIEDKKFVKDIIQNF